MKRRGFEAIGWYWKKCKTFETDGMVERRRKEDIKNVWNLKTDADIDKFVCSGYVESRLRYLTVCYDQFLNEIYVPKYIRGASQDLLEI